MELIFMRHGEAEEAVFGMEDATRNLTEKGRRTTRKAAKGLARLVPPRTNIQIWSSPLARALQTAEIIAARLQAQVKIVNALGSGDVKGVLDLLSNTQDECVIILGHNPFMTECVAQITGVRLYFKKAAAAGIYFEPLTPLNATLVWFTEPRYLKRLR